MVGSNVRVGKRGGMWKRLRLVEPPLAKTNSSQIVSRYIHSVDVYRFLFRVERSCCGIGLRSLDVSEMAQETASALSASPNLFTAFTTIPSAGAG